MENKENSPSSEERNMFLEPLRRIVRNPEPEENTLIEADKDGYLDEEHLCKSGLIPQRYFTKMERAIYKDTKLSEILSILKEIDFLLVCHPKKVQYLRDKYADDKQGYFLEVKELLPSNKRKYEIIIGELLNTAEQRLCDFGQVNGNPYMFNSKYWEFIPKESFQTFLTSVAEKCGMKSYDIRQPNEVKKIISQFMVSASIPAPQTNPNKVLINLQNGTYEISEDQRTFREANSEDLLMYALPFEYNKDAEAPMFSEFLNQVLPDTTQQQVLMEYLGYIFVKGLKLEKCLLIIGDGANGKSVLFDIVSALLGEKNICSYTLSNLCDDKGYYRAQLSNKLLNYSSELGGKNCPPDMVKKLISTEPVDARNIYGAPFELKDYCKFIFNTNTLPKEVEHTGAYFRRFMIIRFGQTIPEDKQDKNLAKKIIASELSGIFNLVLEGLERIVKKKAFTYSKEMEEEINTFRRESNSIAQFLDDEAYVPSPNLYTNLKPLYEEYKTYCINSGYHHVSKIELVRRLKVEGIQTKKGNGNVRNVYCIKSYTPEPSNSNESPLELALKLKA